MQNKIYEKNNLFELFIYKGESLYYHIKGYMSYLENIYLLQS